MKKRSAILCSFLLFMATGIMAEDSLRVFRRTGIYAEMGGGEYIRTNLNAEHFFVNGKWLHLGTQGSFGIWNSWGGGGQEAGLTLSGLVGKKTHFLEVRGGSLLLFQTTGKTEEGNSGNLKEFIPAVFLGYTLRWKHFLFKANVNPSRRYVTFNAGAGVVF